MAVGFFYSRKNGTGQFGTFATKSAHSVALNPFRVCLLGMLRRGNAGF